MAVASLFLIFLFLIIPKLASQVGRGAGVPRRSQKGPVAAMGLLPRCVVAPMPAARCPPGVEVRKERSSSALPSRAPGQAAELCGMSRCLQLLQDGGCLRACFELGALLLCSTKPPLGGLWSRSRSSQASLGKAQICSPPAPLAAP